MLRSRENETLYLSSGNTIGLAHYGDPDGPVVFYFHGLCTSRLEGAYWAKAAESVGAHIIALDRPGIGLSSAQPNRKLLEWPLVVSEVAQNLKIDQFYVLGTTAGGAHALACAKVLSPDTLKGVGLVASFSPRSKSIGSRMKHSLKLWVSRKVYEKVVLPAAKDPDPTVFQTLIVDGLSEKDKALFENVEFRDFQVDAERECPKQGTQGVVDDMRVSVKDWGFDLQGISVKKVGLWCGTEDREGGIGWSRMIEDEIDQATLVEFEGDTHYSTLATRGEQILRGLLFDDEKSNGELLHKDAYN